MRTVGADEARTHLGELLDAAERGETIVVTRHGVAVARIEPVGKNGEDASVEEWRRFRNEHDIRLGEGVTIRDLIDEGRE